MVLCVQWSFQKYCPDASTQKDWYFAQPTRPLNWPQLREPEPFRMVNNNHRRIGYVHADLDHSVVTSMSAIPDLNDSITVFFSFA